MFTSAISAEWQRLDEYNGIIATLSWFNNEYIIAML